MDRKKLQRAGKLAPCAAGAAWLLFLLLCGAADSDGVGMLRLSILVVPLMYAGCVGGAVWLVCAWRQRRAFSKPPRLLAGLNLAAVLVNLPFVAASLPGYLSLL